MSIPHARKGRHAAPSRPTGRRLAVAAATLAAGATPLICAGTATAAPAQRDLATLGLADMSPQLGLPDSLGTLTTGVAPQANQLTGGLVGQATPVVSQLRQAGVPTVGDLTAGLSGTRLPVVGTVGSVTETLPVTTVLGSGSPVTGAVQNLSGL